LLVLQRKFKFVIDIKIYLTNWFNNLDISQVRILMFRKMKRVFLYQTAKYFKGFYFLLSAIALLSGGIIYILFRTSEPAFFNWISAVGLDGWLNFARNSSLSVSPFLPEWIVYSLPNGLWAFAYALLITTIWSDSKFWLKYFWMASIPLLVLGFEILQLTGIIPGTFCIQDIALGIAGLTFGIIVGTKIIKPNHHEKAVD